MITVIRRMCHVEEINVIRVLRSDVKLFSVTADIKCVFTNLIHNMVTFIDNTNLLITMQSINLIINT